ncbi:hypothetical protein [Methanococcus vannielii]|uniref:hypothetical protein n=1 Tax=Methanococcus vannielii TaxID=2187 RepID=UPI0000F0AC78|nr:hypothetical protein [Methanococcus vannielii]
MKKLRTFLEINEKNKSIKKVKEFDNKVRAKKTIKIVCIDDLNNKKKIRENN